MLDFGLAKALEPATATDPSQSPTYPSAATQVGVILGTAAYMSPEQARGKPVDKRADIWAFGCVLYEMLTGRPAFDGETVTDTLAAVLRAEPDWEPVARVAPAAIQTLLRRCFEPDARKRLRDIGDARHELEPAEENGEGGAATGLTVSTRPSSRLLPVWTACGAAVLAGIVVWFVPDAPPAASPVTRSLLDLPSSSQSYADKNTLFALSPDGHSLVYQANGVLNLRDLDTLDSSPMPGTAGGYSPFFSPDGASVGFFTETQLKQVALSGGAPTTISSVANAWLGVWTEDDEIVFADRGPTGLMKVSTAAGSLPQVFTSREGDEIHHHLPVSLLPDGHTVIFGILTDGVVGWDGGRVVAQSTRTNQRTPLREGGSMARYADSGHLVWARSGALFAAPFDADSLKITGPAIVVVEGVRNASRGGIAQYAFSQNGTLVYAQAPPDGGRARDLVWVTRDGVEQPTGVTEDRRTSLITNPSDGKVPSLIPTAAERVAARRAYLRDHPADSWEDRNIAERCILGFNTGPPMSPSAYNNVVQLFQTENHVVLLNEMVHDARIVPLDNRPHLPPHMRQWHGDSRGYWDGDTLVVETINLTNKTSYRGSTESMHLVERFTRSNADTLSYEFTVTDPRAFGQPWTALVPMKMTSSQLFEYACHEGNYGMEGILAGHRAEEKAAKDAPQ